MNSAVNPGSDSPKGGVPGRGGLLGYGGVAVALAVGWATLRQGGYLEWPMCGMQRWFGVPCPFCGSTRALAALGRGDLGEAFFWNPLAAAAALGTLVLAAIVGVRRVAMGQGRWGAGPRGMSLGLRPWHGHTVLPAAVCSVISGVVLLNWLYVWWRQ